MSQRCSARCRSCLEAERSLQGLRLSFSGVGGRGEVLGAQHRALHVASTSACGAGACPRRLGAAFLVLGLGRLPQSFCAEGPACSGSLLVLWQQLRQRSQLPREQSGWVLGRGRARGVGAWIAAGREESSRSVWRRCEQPLLQL